MAAEIIFLTHNDRLHEVNLGWHPRAEDVLWTPATQEPKRSQTGGWNVRYRRGWKGARVKELLDADRAPYALAARALRVLTENFTRARPAIRSVAPCAAPCSPSPASSSRARRGAAPAARPRGGASCAPIWSPTARDVRVEVEAFPAVKLLFKRADRVTVEVSDYRSGGDAARAPRCRTCWPARRPRASSTSTSSVLEDRLLRMQDVRLRKDGDALIADVALRTADVDAALPARLRVTGSDADGITVAGVDERVRHGVARAGADLRRRRGRIVLRPEGIPLAVARHRADLLRRCDRGRGDQRPPHGRRVRRHRARPPARERAPTAQAWSRRSRKKIADERDDHEDRRARAPRGRS